MAGLLADVNIQGHLPYLRRLVQSLEEWPLVAELNVELATFPDVGLDPETDDRAIWNFCQQEGWVLFTDNRNHDGPDSLAATLADTWRVGCLPVLILGSKPRFERSFDYAKQVASDVAELLFDIFHGKFRDQPRVFVPRSLL